MTRRELLDLAARRVLILDGGLATLLISLKVPGPGFCPEVFLLEAFEEVAAIHARYARAGADILLTNTFGGNRARLQASGLAGMLEEINRRGVEAARKAAGTRSLVAADMGPTGLYHQGKKRPASKKVEAIFHEQASALLAAKPDLFLLETFADPHEMELAIRAVRKESDLPVVAMMTYANGGKTALGFSATDCRDSSLDAGADIPGANCSSGAASVLEALRAMAAGYAGPLAAEPNAGLPRWRQEIRRYEEGPAVMARFAPRFVRAGARLIGGCCGTTPAHISSLRRALL
ncbi:MAG TPA: homocysteine S-methyltransferase family protein [Candidatus Polarisedimenticolia bacterium]|jgi:5-methyltetrahydrofolate--homocysteine methyltransferase|nr:homocysteine S-methyltransferase family protein [Candidatus Polarisedimenticolia bacterium]